MNVHAWVVVLLFESFHILFWILFDVSNFSNLKIEVEQTQQDSSSFSATSKSISLTSHERQSSRATCAWHKLLGLMSRCAIETECKYSTAAAALLNATRTPLLSLCLSFVDWFNDLPSNSMRNAGFGTSWAETTVTMFGCRQAFRIANSRKNSSTNSGFKIRFIAAGVSWAISVPARTIPVAPVAITSLQAKMLLQTEEKQYDSKPRPHGRLFNPLNHSSDWNSTKPLTAVQVSWCFQRHMFFNHFPSLKFFACDLSIPLVCTNFSHLFLDANQSLCIEGR